MFWWVLVNWEKNGILFKMLWKVTKGKEKGCQKTEKDRGHVFQKATNVSIVVTETQYDFGRVCYQTLLRFTVPGSKGSFIAFLC